MSAVINEGLPECIHEWEEFIDPQSGGWMRCRKCGRAVDCEDPDMDLG